MLSENEIEALKNGAYGVTKNGEKVKFFGETDNNTFLYARYNSDGLIEGVLYYDLPHYFFRDRRDSIYNIVGLWVDKLESFNLDRALAGEPVKTRDGCKAYVQIKIEQPNELINYALIGYGFNGNHREFLHWSENGRVLSDDISCDDIIGMWKEPEHVASSVDDLPKPIREFGDLEECWSIVMDDYSLRPLHRAKYNGWGPNITTELKNGLIYATEEDCKKVCDWFMGR